MMGRSLKRDRSWTGICAKRWRPEYPKREKSNQDVVAALHHRAGHDRPTIAVHNGKKFIPVYVTEQMIATNWEIFTHTHVLKGHGGRRARARCRTGTSRRRPQEHQRQRRRGLKTG